MAEAEVQASEACPAKRTKFSDDGLSHLTPGHSITSSSPALSAYLRVQLKCHPEIWFDDGNIVLITGDSAIAFRIYRGLLSAQSTVFLDMFASSTSSPDETFDGCPVVYLSDSPYDLAHLLQVLLLTLQVSYHPTKEDPIRTFDEVSAIIHLAHKYHIPQVQNQALSSLQDYHFTDSFSVFCNTQHPRSSEIVINPVHTIGAVNLARLTDTPSMLPLALYQCAYLSDALLDSWTCADGTIKRLSDADLRQCLATRITLVHERFFIVSRILDPTTCTAKCRKPSRCHASLHFVHACVMSWEAVRAEEEDEEKGAGDGVLRDWKQSIGRLTNFGKSLCERCVKELAKRSMNERRSLWNRLPEVFGIEVEDWGEPEPEVIAETGLAVGDMEDSDNSASDDLDLELF